MINAENYYSKTSGIDFSTLPPALKKGHEFVDKVTQNGSSWDNYNSSPTIQKVINEYFQKLSEHFPKEEKQKERKETKREEKITEPKKEKVRKERAPKHKKAESEKKDEEEKAELVERIPEELRFMRRYINLNGKKKTKEELLRFINSLQRAILERRIRKESSWAKQINYMQEKLLDAYNGMKSRSIEIEITPKTLSEFKKEIDSQKNYLSIQLIKRYVNLHGKVGIKEKAKKLFEQMNRAVKKKKIVKSDKYAEKLNKIWLSLQDFLSDKNKKTLPVNSAELNGLLGFLGECNCGLSGLDETPQRGNKIMNSMEFADMEFDSIGFTGKWKDLIGDPAPGFTAMVFGKPKMGKSYLCVEFAGSCTQSWKGFICSA
jgi:hypothetical protein